MDVHDRGGIGPQEALNPTNQLLQLSESNNAFPASLAESIEAKGDSIKQASMSSMLAAMASGALPYSIIDNIRTELTQFTGNALASAGITAK